MEGYLLGFWVVVLPSNQSDHSVEAMYSSVLTDMEILLMKRGLWLAAIKMFQSRYKDLTQQGATKMLLPYANLIARKAANNG